MEKTEKLYYPQNAYHDIFGGKVNLPVNAEEALEYVLATLSQQESEAFMLRYKDSTIQNKFEEENEEDLVTMQILRKLRHPRLSKILIGQVQIPRK